MDELESIIKELLQNYPKKFVAVRHQIEDEPDDNWIMDERCLAGLGVLEKHDVAYDLLFFPKHLKHIPALCSKFPNLRLVIDHIAKPSIKSQTVEVFLCVCVVCSVCSVCCEY